MKKAYSYIRFSTPDQLKGDSLRRQLEASRAYAEQHNLLLDDTLRDLGVSGFRGKNRTEGALKEFIDLVENGEIAEGSVLILESLDRLSRDEIMSSLNLFTSLLAAGIEIVTLADGQRYTKKSINDIGQLIISLVVMSRAHEESAMKSKRLSASWENKRKLAIESKRPMTARCPYWLRLKEDRSSYEIIEERAAIVREIFEKTIAGKGKRTIASELNQRGVDTWEVGKRKGKFWQSSYVAKILENRAVFGEFQPCKKSDRKPVGVAIPDYYPAVVTFEEFAQAQAAIKSRRVCGGRKGKGFSNLFTGVCKCGVCGSTARFLNKGKRPRGGKYLVCSNRHAKAGCSNSKHWRYDYFEKVALILLSDKINWQAALSSNSSDKARLEKELICAEQELADAKKKVERFSLLFESADESMLSHAATKYKDAMKLETELIAKIKTIKENLAAYVPSSSAVDDLYNALHAIADAEKYSSAELVDARTKVNAAMKKIGLLLAFYPDFCLYLVKATGEKGLLCYADKLADTHEIFDIADELETVNRDIEKINTMIEELSDI
ncbi:recombinase family protein [Mariprofundus ferrooxydans]|uniref:recombinase family protein n=1 Tax=Mariprofundus ferrooxydans TaxID=314344 RepID=UPI00037198F6|nr:recombinase family protein [Mariprofundus ferrooxydans]